ncbi:hypothetical protein HKX48_008163 [Thoreauomyces humboldtii]|nr:hypothetical protein HKX48_008163 [Thoreauomyces humboldtii]
MDAVTRRRIALASGLGICAWIAKEALEIHAGDVKPLLPHLWFLVTTLYFGGLWWAQIPLLDFRFPVYFVITIGVWLVEGGLYGSLIPIIIMEDPDIKEVEPCRTQALFNPEHQTFCLKASEKSTTIPLKVQGTPPWTITYEAWGFDGSYQLFSNVTLDGPAVGLKAQAETKARIVETYQLAAPKPAVYRLLSIRESVGDEGKIIQPFVDVVQCPAAVLVASDGDAELTHVDRCLDQSYDFDVAITGTPPFTSWYLRQVGHSGSLMRIEGDLDDEAVPPLKKSKRIVPDVIRERLLAGQARHLSIPVAVKVEAATEHLFKLVQVSDGYNNTVIYRTDLSHEQPPATDHVVQADHQGNTVLVHGRALPEARFERCDSVRIRAGYEHESADIPVTLQGSAPWELRYGRSESDEDAAAGIYGEVAIVKDIEHPRLSLTVKKPGVYVLLSVSDKYCSGNVELPTTCLVQQAVPPEMTMSVAPVVKECFGATGVDVNISMSGEPPFWVEFDQNNKANGHRQQARRQFTKAFTTLRFEPGEPGQYEYSFTKIGDAIYSNGVIVSGMGFKQLVHALPDVTIATVEKTRCLGDHSKLDVQITGVPPYVLTYEILKGSKKERFVLPDVTEKELSIDTPPFNQAGTYYVDVTELTDGNGCTAPVASRPIAIEVLTQRPSAHFQCPKPILMLEGAGARIPVVVSGHGKYKLKYRTEEDKHIASITGDKTISGLQVNKAGTYELVSLEDAFCSGRVLEPSRFLTVPKPDLSIPRAEYHSIESGIHIRSHICEGTPDRMDLHLTGKAPFKINYKHEHSVGHTVISSSNEHAVGTQDKGAQQYSRIKLVTDQPGDHTYTFASISDEHYRSPVHVANGGPKLRQRVYARPTATFLDGPVRNFQCISKESDTELRIKLGGTGPWNVQLHSKHESHIREVIDLETKEPLFVFRPSRFETTGKYVYTIRSVTDATGCEHILTGNEPGGRVEVQVADMARITMDRGLKHTCVGDMLSYSLEGTAPFTIGYDWNGVHKKELTIKDPVLMLFAGEAGTVNVTRVCNSMKCCYEPPGGLVAEISPLPKVRVDGGYDMVDDIREGDNSIISFEFEGTPPFSFRYSRTPLHDRNTKKSEQPQLFTADVADHRHEIVTDKEGLFEVTWIKDRFCEFPLLKMANPKMANARLQT